MTTAHDALRARVTVRTADEARALAALTIGAGWSPWLLAQVITALGNDGRLTGDTAGGYGRYIMTAAYRELLADEPAARQIPRSPGIWPAIVCAVTRIRQHRFNWPAAPTYLHFGYSFPAGARAVGEGLWSSGWTQYVDAAAVRWETRGES